MEGKTNKAIFSEIYAKNVWGGVMNLSFPEAVRIMRKS